MKLISIIVPIYNSENYIERCVNSLINQTYKNLEIILINDGSTDNSIKLCEAFAKKDKRVKIINKENEGVSIARNIGIENSHGDYIMFVDIDDWIDNDTIEQMYNVVKKENVDIVKCNSVNEFLSKKTYNLIADEISNIRMVDNKYKIEILKILSTTSKLNVVWGQLVRKDIIENIRFESNIGYGEDLLFNVQCLKKCTSMYFLNKSLYHYYINQDGICRDYSKQVLDKKIQDVLYIYPQILDIVNSWDNKFEKQISGKFIKELLENILRMIMVYEDEVLYKKIIADIINNKNYRKCIGNLTKEDIIIRKYKFKIPLKLLYDKKIKTLYIYAKFIYKPMRKIYKYLKR